MALAIIFALEHCSKKSSSELFIFIEKMKQIESLPKLKFVTLKVIVLNLNNGIFLKYNMYHSLCEVQ